MSSKQWKVHKFGGSSLTDAQCFRRVSDILLAEPHPLTAVVVSAMGGMTDALLRLVAAAEQSSERVADDLTEISDRYHRTVRELLDDAAVVATVTEPFDSDLRDASDVLRGISLVHSAADRSRDLIAGFGELWSARLLAAYLARRSSTIPDGPRVDWVDARRLIVVHQGEMGPAVHWERSLENAAERFDASEDGIVVVTGYIASDPDGLYTTLGRNGSDFSASIVGALLEAESISIWTDVDGVMSADPPISVQRSSTRRPCRRRSSARFRFGSGILFIRPRAVPGSGPGGMPANRSRASPRLTTWRWSTSKGPA